MTVSEKMERLTRFCHKKRVSEAAGLGSQYLYNVVHGKHRLTSRTAVALARVLGVDPGWLIDDSKGFPPVRVEAPEDGDHAPTPIAA